jgi:hypothetical protein
MRIKGEEVLFLEFGLFDVGGLIYTQKTLGGLHSSGGARYE